MNTLTYGVKQPETGDKGSVFFPALEDGLAYLNDHTHDSIEGAPIPATNIQPVTQAVSAAGWLSIGSGRFRQLLTVPNGKNFADVDVTFKDSVTFQKLYLNTEAVSSTTFYVKINDNTVSLIATYRG